MVDMDAAEDVVAVFVHDPERKLLVASTEGRGFVVPEAEMLANTRKGKQVMTRRRRRRRCGSASPAAGDMVAMLGENRKLLIFPLDQVPEMTRGKGVRLQKYKDGGVADARVFTKADGLTWMDSSGPELQPADGRAEGLGRRPRPGRPPAAAGLPAARTSSARRASDEPRCTPRPKPSGLCIARSISSICTTPTARLIRLTRPSRRRGPATRPRSSRRRSTTTPTTCAGA